MESKIRARNIRQSPVCVGGWGTYFDRYIVEDVITGEIKHTRIQLASVGSRIYIIICYFFA